MKEKIIAVLHLFSSGAFISKFLLSLFKLIVGWSGLQVKVWLGSNADHYYILSRFLISRMLLVTKVHFTNSHVQIDEAPL